MNPESHGNLATSAIGRTCTRSNLKARSRSREQEKKRERERLGHSFIRTQCVSYVRTLVPFIDRALFFICCSPSPLPPRVRSGGAPWDTSGSTFIVNEGPPSLHFRLRRPHWSFAYIALSRQDCPIIAPNFVISHAIKFYWGKDKTTNPFNP